MYLPDVQSIIAAGLALSGTLTERLSTILQSLLPANRICSEDCLLWEDSGLRCREVH